MDKKVREPREAVEKGRKEADTLERETIGLLTSRRAANK